MLLFFAGGAEGDPAALRDFTDFKLEELGVKLVTAKTDPKTHFQVGGKNSAATIKGLTEINGVELDQLEADMRPGKLSRAGFLGPNEKLLDILAGDNQYVVDKLGLTHQELAKHLHVLAAIGLWQGKHKETESPFRYHGRKFRVKIVGFRGFVGSPFDDQTKTNSEATLFNLDNGKELKYSLLVPHMIERYGFYEGKGTPYRVDPRKILETLDFLKKRR
jgi:hypothetical protein